jgi:hypothetical protein
MTTWYVDASMPTDTADGLTPATAKQNYKTAYLAATDGDTILLRAGRCYAPVAGFYTQVRKRLTIEPYDLTPGADPWDDYPCLDSLTYENADATGWAHAGSGVWYKVFGSAKTVRLWTGGSNTGVLKSQRTIGTARSRTPGATADVEATIITALTNGAGDVWHPCGSGLSWRLYVYTGSTTVAPPAFYNGLVLSCNDGANYGSGNGFMVTQTNGVRINKMHVRGGSDASYYAATLTTDTQPTYDIIFTDCLASHMYTGGFHCRPGAQNAVAWKPVRDVLFKRCIGKTFTSAQEQDKSMSYTFTALCDMFQILDNCYNCHAIDCESIDASHVGLVLGCQNSNAHTPESCGFLRHKVTFGSYCTYARGIATGRCGTGCYVMGCTIDGQNVRSQIIDGYIVGNKWINNRASMRKADTCEWFAVEAYIIDRGQTSIGNDRYEYLYPTNLVVANNLCVNPVASNTQPIIITTYDTAYPVPDPNIDPYTITIANNVIIDEQTVSRYLIGVFQNGPGTIGPQKIYNNIVWTGQGNPAPTVRWLGVTYDLNSAPGCSGNLLVDPQLDPITYKPLAGSPAIGAGQFAGYYPDAEGKSFNIPPSIGLYEVDTTLTTRTART